MGEIDHEWRNEYTPMKHLRSQYLQKNAVAPKYIPQQNLQEVKEAHAKVWVDINERIDNKFVARQIKEQHR